MCVVGRKGRKARGEGGEDERKGQSLLRLLVPFSPFLTTLAGFAIARTLSTFNPSTQFAPTARLAGKGGSGRSRAQMNEEHGKQSSKLTSTVGITGVCCCLTR